MRNQAETYAALCAAFAELNDHRVVVEALLAKSPGANASTHVADLALAWSAALGVAAAQTKFDTSVLQPARAQLQRRGTPEWVLDEAMQTTRISLLLGKTGKSEAENSASDPGLLTYTGRGPLLAFVRVTMARNALRLHPRKQHITVDELLAPLNNEDIELTQLQARYGGIVRTAVGTAWDRLPKHDRFILSLQLHGHLAVAQIAQLYAIQPVSAARRLASARASLLAGVRFELRSVLQAGEATAASVLRLLAPAISVGDLRPATGIGPPTTSA